MRFTAVLPIMLLLSGCSLNLQELRDISPEVDHYPGALAAEYLAYSNAELEQGRRASAEYFAGKGLDANQGKTVVPDAVSPKAPKALSAARASLISLLTDDVKRAAPQKAARAQLLFECWNAQASKKIDNGAECADGFAGALEELHEVADAFIQGEEKTYTVRFESGSAELSAEAAKTAQDAAESISGQKKYVIKLQAHHDTKSKLVQQRLKATSEALVKAGAWPDNIRILRVNNDKAVFLSNDEVPPENDGIDVIVKSQTNAETGL